MVDTALQKYPEVFMSYMIPTHFRTCLEDLGPDIDPFLSKFFSIFRRSWFSRIWVIQEVAVATQDPICIAGRICCKLRRLVSAYNATYLKAILWMGRPDPYADEVPVGGLRGPQFGSPREQVYDVVQERGDGGNILDRLAELLKIFDGRLHSTVPHDILYGLLGLLKCSYFPKSLRPDYEKEFSRVYLDYSKALIMATGDICLIMRVRGSLVRVPSWVPDFCQLRTDNGKKLGMRKSPRRVTASDVGDKLIVQGLEYGRVSRVYVPDGFMSATLNIEQDLRSFDAFLTAAAEVGRISYPVLFDSWFVMALTELSSVQSKYFPAEYFEDFYRATVHGTSYLYKLEDKERAIIHQRFSVQIKQQWLATDTGAIFKFCREDIRIREGDAVIGILDLRCGLVLRPSLEDEETYMFLGDCNFWVGGNEVHKLRGSRLASAGASMPSIELDTFSIT